MSIRRSVAIVTAAALMLSLAARAETLVNRKTGETATGKLLGSVTKDGQPQYYLRGEDGKARYLAQDEWDKKEDSAPPKGNPGTAPAKKGGAAVDVDFGEKKPPAAKLKVMEVVAAGVGTDPDKAKLSAFSNAIEKAVGVLVDAETLVKSDQIVRDQILTFSRGFVEDFRILEQAEKDGLYTVLIRATVARTKLVDKLIAANISVRDVAGERIALQIEQEVIAEKNAAEMFRKSMEGFSPKTVTKIELVEGPDVLHRDGKRAILGVKAMWSPDFEGWAKVREGLVPLLEKLATDRGAFTTDESVECGSGAVLKLRKGSANGGMRLALLRQLDAKKKLATWDVFVVPSSLGTVLWEMRAIPWKFTVALLDASGRPVAEKEQDTRVAIEVYYGYGGRDVWFLGPVFFKDMGSYCSGSYFHHDSIPFGAKLEVDLDVLRRVAKCATSIEKGKAKGSP